MFKDLPEGQTHYDPEAERKGKLDELIRDLTKVGSISKSEARRRITEYGNERVRECVEGIPTGALVLAKDISNPNLPCKGTEELKQSLITKYIKE